MLIHELIERLKIAAIKPLANDRLGDLAPFIRGLNRQRRTLAN